MPADTLREDMCRIVECVEQHRFMSNDAWKANVIDALRARFGSETELQTYLIEFIVALTRHMARVEALLQRSSAVNASTCIELGTLRRRNDALEKELQTARASYQVAEASLFAQWSPTPDEIAAIFEDE